MILILNFFGIAKIVGMLHDIGHTAFSHDGEVILDRMLQEVSARLFLYLSVLMPTSIISDVFKNTVFTKTFQKMYSTMPMLHCSSIFRSWKSILSMII